MELVSDLTASWLISHRAEPEILAKVKVNDCIPEDLSESEDDNQDEDGNPAAKDRAFD